MRRTGWCLLLALCTCAACAKDIQPCIPGYVLDCTCPDGTPSTAVCTADGTALDCACASGATGSGTSGSIGGSVGSSGSGSSGSIGGSSSSGGFCNLTQSFYQSYVGEAAPCFSLGTDAGFSLLACQVGLNDCTSNEQVVLQSYAANYIQPATECIQLLGDCTPQTEANWTASFTGCTNDLDTVQLFDAGVSEGCLSGIGL